MCRSPKPLRRARLRCRFAFTAHRALQALDDGIQGAVEQRDVFQQQRACRAQLRLVDMSPLPFAARLVGEVCKHP